jgi:putative ABC transport system permease protein
MKAIYLKDMVYRKARVILTVISVACLVLLILLMGGMMKGLRMQARSYVKSIDRQAGTGIVWLSTERSGSTFVGLSLLDSEYLEVLRTAKGVDKDKALSPLIFAQARPVINGKEKKAIVVGYQSGSLGGPSENDITDPKSPFYPVTGRLFQASEFSGPEYTPPAEVVVDERLGLEIGQTVELSGKPLRVVGKTKGQLFVFDTPLMFMDLRTAQKTILSNILYINTMLVKAEPNYNEAQLAEDIKKLSLISVDTHTGNQIVKIILANYVDEPMKGVRALRALLWLATGLIVAMITYVTTLEKTREIGVLKAIGASNKYVIMMILKQVLVTTVAGVILGVVLAIVMARFFPIMVLISLGESLLVAVITIVVCLYGGYIAAKRTAAVDPMIAFRGR